MGGALSCNGWGIVKHTYLWGIVERTHLFPTDVSDRSVWQQCSRQNVLLAQIVHVLLYCCSTITDTWHVYTPGGVRLQGGWVGGSDGE